MPRTSDIYCNLGGFNFREPRITAKTKSSGIDRESALVLFEKYKDLALWTVSHRYPTAMYPGILCDEIKNEALTILWKLILSMGEKLTTHKVSNNIWSRVGSSICKKNFSILRNDYLDNIAELQNNLYTNNDDEYVNKLLVSSGIKRRTIVIIKMNMNGYSFVEIAKKYHITRTRAYQLYWKGIKKMRNTARLMEIRYG